MVLSPALPYIEKKHPPFPETHPGFGRNYLRLPPRTPQTPARSRRVLLSSSLPEALRRGYRLSPLSPVRDKRLGFRPPPTHPAPPSPPTLAVAAPSPASRIQSPTPSPTASSLCRQPLPGAPRQRIDAARPVHPSRRPPARPRPPARLRPGLTSAFSSPPSTFRISFSSDAQSHGDDEEPCENIFSQPFHHHNEGDSDGLSKYSFVRWVDTLIAVPVQSTCGNTKRANNEYSELGSLSPEVSAIYLAMQHSKLEYECADPDEAEEFDEFDPYSFIKDLPELSMVVPKFYRSSSKANWSCPRTTLVLDLDETLVHSTLEPCEDSDFTFPVRFNLRDHTIYVRCRPYLKDFLERVASMFEIIIFTASQSIYAEQLLNVLDPKEGCSVIEFIASLASRGGNYLKDLSVLGRDLSRVVIIDNSPQAFGFQLDNGIPIESWFDDPSDKEL
ncbi:hypothetical protein ZWY2020_027892 [Hordeum vulgare]|nr:hypothetical protein ZWY2020_027892 [Hordeum vulgare]